MLKRMEVRDREIDGEGRISMWLFNEIPMTKQIMLQNRVGITTSRQEICSLGGGGGYLGCGDPSTQ